MADREVFILLPRDGWVLPTLFFIIDSLVKVVILANAGIQGPSICLKRLDSRFHGNDGKYFYRTYYDCINFDNLAKKSNFHTETQRPRRKSQEYRFFLFVASWLSVALFLAIV